MLYFQKNMHIFLLFYLLIHETKERLFQFIRFSLFFLTSLALIVGIINYYFQPFQNNYRIPVIKKYDTYLFRHFGNSNLNWFYQAFSPRWTEIDLYADSREIFSLLDSNNSDYSKKIRSIYLTGYSATDKKISHYIKYVKRTGMNSIVFDIKDITGYINYPSKINIVSSYQKYHFPIKNLNRLVDRLRKNELYAIARISQFQDLYMARKKKAWALYHKNGSPYTVKGKPAWLDPANKEMQDYNIRIIHEVLQSKVNEIQLDYIRYPTDGNWRSVQYKKIKNFNQKPIVLTKYLQRVHSLARAYQIPLSIDVFGVVAWQERLDILSTGQNLRIMSQATDIISPMLYPSHFGDVFSGIQNPADSPEFFLYNGCIKVKNIVPKNIVIRPWIQAFPLKVSNYNSSYIEKQIIGSYRAGAKGYMKWNAGNRYIYFTEPDLKTTMRKNTSSDKKSSI